jgi:hypothetical protein
MLKRNYFVSAYYKSKKGANGKTEEHYCNGIIKISIFQRKNHELLGRIVQTFAGNIANQNEGMEFKEFVIIAFNRV